MKRQWSAGRMKGREAKTKKVRWSRGTGLALDDACSTACTCHTL